MQRLIGGRGGGPIDVKSLGVKARWSAGRGLGGGRRRNWMFQYFILATFRARPRRVRTRVGGAKQLWTVPTQRVEGQVDPQRRRGAAVPGVLCEAAALPRDGLGPEAKRAVGCISLEDAPSPAAPSEAPGAFKYGDRSD